MSVLLTEVMFFMSCTFLLGLALGWVAWRIGSEKERKILVSQAEFWQSQLDEARLKRDADLSRIDMLAKEKANLQKRLASLKT